MRTSRSHAARIVVAGCLGALSTIAVAWLSVLFTSPMKAPSVRGQIETDEFITTFNVRSSFLLTEVYWSGYSPRGSVRPYEKGNHRVDALPRWSRASSPSPADLIMQQSASSADQTWEIGSGWPARAMLSVLHDHPTWMSGGGIPYVTISGIPLPAMRVDNALQARSLPVRVLPLGFAYDVVVHAMAWWLLFFGAASLREFRRRRRGACLSCGYGPLASAASGCPECGWNRTG
ncbi:MAG: hypothetical protein U0572_14225 [Phycisphaerales bacterium]